MGTRKRKRKPGMMGIESGLSLERILIGVVVLLAAISFLSLTFGENNQIFVIIGVAVGVILLVMGFLLFNYWKRKQARKKFENAKIDKMLSKPLIPFGENYGKEKSENKDEATKLAEMYDESS